MIPLQIKNKKSLKVKLFIDLSISSKGGHTDAAFADFVSDGKHFLTITFTNHLTLLE